MAEEHPEEVDAVQHKLQQILLSVARTHTRAPVAEVRQVLSMAIEAAGIPEQPQKWLSDAAGDISAGRLLVLNAREEHRLHVGIRSEQSGQGERTAQAVTTDDASTPGSPGSGSGVSGAPAPGEERRP
ncbi:MAG: hypothetical protein ACLGIA_09435 [Actinomycetes bacterium]